jgi:hypothetical protein
MISKLGTLISYDSETDKDKISKAKKDLEVEGLEAQKTIEQIIKDSNQKFHLQAQQRSKLIEDTFNKMIPAIPEEKKEEIQNHVREAVKKGPSQAEIEDLDDYA